MNAYDKLKEVSNNNTFLVEVHNDKYEGVATFTKDNNVKVFFGKSDGSDDTVFTPQEFNENWTVGKAVF